MIFGKSPETEEQPIIRKVTKSQEILPKKKKKEPSKPWGKKERLVVLLVLVFTVLTSLILALSARAWKLPGLPRLNISLFPLLKEETIVLENENKKSTPPELIAKSEKVISDFQDATADLSGVYGLYVVDLESGFTFGVDENEIFEAASLIKLPVMTAMFQEAEKGNLDLESTYILQTSDKIGGSGSLYSAPAGTKVTYGRLIELMGNQSDNTAFGIARKILGDKKITETIVNLNLNSTSLAENETSPADIGRFFQKLWQQDILNSENTAKYLQTLTETSYEAWLPAGIPDSIQVAHKYGREVHVVNDAGIVYTDKPFVLVILSKGVVEREADLAFPELAEIVFKDWD